MEFSTNKRQEKMVVDKGHKHIILSYTSSRNVKRCNVLQIKYAQQKYLFKMEILLNHMIYCKNVFS